MGRSGGSRGRNCAGGSGLTGRRPCFKESGEKVGGVSGWNGSAANKRATRKGSRGRGAFGRATCGDGWSCIGLQLANRSRRVFVRFLVAFVKHETLGRVWKHEFRAERKSATE